MVLLTDARMKEDPSIPSIAETLTTLKKAGIDRIVATTLYNQRNYKDFVSEGRLMDIDRNLADSLTKDAASWIVETVSEGRQYKVTKDSYQFYLERRTTVPVLEQKVTPKPEPTAYKPEPAKLPETGSNDSSNQTLLGLGIMLAGFGLATSARKSKEQ